MVAQTIAALLLAIPLVAIVVISVPYWIKFKNGSKHKNAKQEIPYNKFFLSLLGLGYFCIWPFWMGGIVSLFLNKHDSIPGLLTSSFLSILLCTGCSALTIQIAGFLVFYVGAMMLYWAIFFAGKYLRPSISGVYKEHKLIQTGPLGIVRHPYYVSYVLIPVGLSLVLLTWWPLIPAVCVMIGMYPTARTEEKMLIKRGNFKNRVFLKLPRPLEYIIYYIIINYVFDPITRFFQNGNFERTSNGLGRSTLYTNAKLVCFSRDFFLM